MLTGKCKTDFEAWATECRMPKLLNEYQFLLVAAIVQFFYRQHIYIVSLPGLSHTTCMVTDHKTDEAENVTLRQKNSLLACQIKAIGIANDFYNERK